MEEKINILPFNSGTDSATAMAMMNNNPWMYLVMLALFGGGMWGNRGGDFDTLSKLNNLSSQINDNNNNQWAREAIQGNGFAISQLALNLNVDSNAVREAVGNVKDAVFNLGAQNGMGFMGVTNAVNLGNLNLIQQLKDCCCASQKLILEQGYQGRIETINQTNDLLTGMRAENGLTRATVDAFRLAWENSRYQDVVAEKTRLQTELDLLRQSQGTQVAINSAVTPIQLELQRVEWQLNNLLNVYGLNNKTTTTNG